MSTAKGQPLDGDAIASEAAPAQEPPSQVVILIIDDETAVAQATAMLLDVMGYATVTAASFEEAELWFAVEGRAPDMVLCDLHLAAGEDGGQTIARIRRMAGRAMPAVLITGDSPEAMTSASQHIENCHLLRKPLDGDELLALMQQLT